MGMTSVGGTGVPSVTGNTPGVSPAGRRWLLRFMPGSGSEVGPITAPVTGLVPGDFVRGLTIHFRGSLPILWCDISVVPVAATDPDMEKAGVR